MFCACVHRGVMVRGLLLAMLMVWGLPGGDAEARGFKLKREKIHADGTITAWSQDGDRGVRTPVRRDRFGALEVYVPNWGWERCGPTCAYTVQKYGLDFWAEQTENGIGVGYLSFDFSR